MKTPLVLIFYFILTIGSAISQTICKDNICTNLIEQSDLFPKYEDNFVVLKDAAVKKLNKLESEGVLFDLNCKFPSFWIFSIKENKKIKKIDKAKAIGTAIEIDRHLSCDINKATLAVPILYNGGEHWAVNGYDSDPVFLDNCFISYITNPDFWCDGLPSEPTEYNICNICGKSYASQVFTSKIGNTITESTYVNNAKGTCLNGGNHDNLKLEANKVCPTSKGNEFRK